MHDSLTVEVALRRFTAWRGAVSLLAMLGLASLLAWTSSRTAWTVGWQLAVGAGAATTLLLVSRSLLAMVPGVLACRHGRWTFTPESRPAAAGTAVLTPPAPVDVGVEVALDFGGFLLLRLVAVDPAAKPRQRWLAAERRGATERWQALRCALYAPRPAATASGASAPLAE